MGAPGSGRARRRDRGIPRLILAWAALAAGCAPTGDPRLASGGATTQLSSEHGRGVTISGDEVSAVSKPINAPADQAWAALLRALPESGVPLHVVHEPSRTAGTRGARARTRFAGRPISTFLSCGGTAGVAEIANAYEVTLGVLATVRPAGSTAELEVRVSGSAKDPFTSVPARQCVSTGKLEARVDSAVRAALDRRR
jgi:hypothetical protein